MVKPVFDTLKYSKKLISAGEDASIAAVHAEALAEMAEDKLATKDDIQKLDKDLRQEMNLMESRLNGRIDMLSSHLTIRMGTMIGAGVALIVVLQKIL